MSASRVPLITPDELTKTVQMHPADWGSPRNIDVAGLEEELRNNIEGEVRFDAGSKAMYAGGRFKLPAGADRSGGAALQRRRSRRSRCMPDLVERRKTSLRRARRRAVTALVLIALGGAILFKMIRKRR